NASDVDGDDLSVSNVAADGGTLTDNGDGTWTFEPADDFSGNIDLSYDVSDGTETVQAGGSITVEAVADGPTISISLGEGVTTTTAPDPVDVTINSSNVTSGDNGFTVTGRSIVNGQQTEASAENVQIHSGTPEGFGVSGNASGSSSEIGHDRASGLSEELVVDFDQDISSVDVSFAWQNSEEEAAFDLYKDGVKVGEGSIVGGSDGIDQAVTLTADNGAEFDQIVFSAPGNDDDFLIHSIDYQVTEDGETHTDFPINISVELTDTDGSESLSDVTLSDIPDGTTLLVNGEEVNVTNGSADISVEDLGNVVLRVPEGSDDFNLQVSATSTESGSSDTATTQISETITVDDVIAENNDNNDSNISRTDAENENVNNDDYRNASDAQNEMPGYRGFSEVNGNGYDNDLRGHSKAWRTDGDELYQGRDGDDVLGNSGNNYGDDLMIGGEGDDIAYGDTGHDVIYGDDGDNIDAVNDNAPVGGDDTLYGGSGNDEIYGEGGNDVIDGGSGNDFLVGGSGDDELVGDSGNDTLHGGSGEDDLSGGWGSDNLQGGSGNDTLDGQGGNDVLNGGSGDDVLKGGDDWGNDTLDGGAGDDTLLGGNGSDVLNGGDGNDTLDAGDSWDSNELNGGDGDDTFYGGQGNDTMIGGDGDDLFYFGEGSGDDVVDGGDGAGWMDTVYLQNEDGTEVNEDDWTIELESGSIEEQADGYIELSEDAEGTITFSDGSELDFDGIDRFEW
ncbi:MAG: cadherin-like domain-containing protein, partial [Methylocystaceae bacterium]|nr:cadherin-like domain-containing protein [Methylocystaceae bacterium]